MDWIRPGPRSGAEYFTSWIPGYSVRFSHIWARFQANFLLYWGFPEERQAKKKTKHAESNLRHPSIDRSTEAT